MRERDSRHHHHNNHIKDLNQMLAVCLSVCLSGERGEKNKKQRGDFVFKLYLQDTTQCSRAEEAAAAAAAATKIDTLGITVSICCCRHCPAPMFCNLLGTLWHALRLEGQRQVHVYPPPFHPPLLATSACISHSSADFCFRDSWKELCS